MDPITGLRGKLGKVAHLERWVSTITSLTSATDTEFTVTFEWDESMGVPGAFIIRNNHHSQFYLKTVTIEDIPGHGPVNFVCNSWIYPAHRYAHDRVFFANKVTWSKRLLALLMSLLLLLSIHKNKTKIKIKLLLNYIQNTDSLGVISFSSNEIHIWFSPLGGTTLRF